MFVDICFYLYCNNFKYMYTWIGSSRAEDLNWLENRCWNNSQLLLSLTWWHLPVKECIYPPILLSLLSQTLLASWLARFIPSYCALREREREVWVCDCVAAATAFAARWTIVVYFYFPLRKKFDLKSAIVRSFRLARFRLAILFRLLLLLRLIR